jgi:hypothetical protein
VNSDLALVLEESITEVQSQVSDIQTGIKQDVIRPIQAIARRVDSLHHQGEEIIDSLGRTKDIIADHITHVAPQIHAMHYAQTAHQQLLETSFKEQCIKNDEISTSLATIKQDMLVLLASSQRKEVDPTLSAELDVHRQEKKLRASIRRLLGSILPSRAGIIIDEGDVDGEVGRLSLDWGSDYNHDGVASLGDIRAIIEALWVLICSLGQNASQPFQKLTSPWNSTIDSSVNDLHGWISLLFTSSTDDELPRFQSGNGKIMERMRWEYSLEEGKVVLRVQRALENGHSEMTAKHDTADLVYLPSVFAGERKRAFQWTLSKTFNRMGFTTISPKLRVFNLIDTDYSVLEEYISLEHKNFLDATFTKRDIFWDIAYSDLESIKKRLQNGEVSVNDRNQEGRTLLHVRALQKTHLDLSSRMC